MNSVEFQQMCVQLRIAYSIIEQADLMGLNPLIKETSEQKFANST